QPGGVEVLSRRLTPDRRLARELPAGGELWELRLPPLSSEEIVIAGARAQPLSLPARVGLVFLPQSLATTSRAIVEAAESLGLQPSAHRLEDVPTASNFVDETTGKTSRRWEWRYSDPASALSLVSRSQGLTDSPCLARLDLRSLIAASQDAYDYHHADCLLPALERPIRLQLPGNAELLVTTLDGVRQTNAAAETVVIPPRSGDRERRLQLVYRTPHRSGFLVDRGTISVPVSDDVVWTGLRWEFFVPPGSRLADEPLGVRLEQPLPRQNWWTRLFGPLGRTSSQALFVPWSLSGWQNLTPSSASPSLAVTLTTSTTLTPPAEWQGFVAYAQSTADIELITWHAGRLRLLAWLGVLVTFIAAVLLRLIGWGMRDRAAAVWLAVLGGFALTWEGPSSELIGGIIAGTVIAVLVPRQWLGLKWWSGSPRVPLGSTQSFRLPPGAMTAGLCLAVVGLTASNSPIADETPWQPETTVLVPVDTDGKPSQRVPLVYLHPQTLERLRAATQKETAPPAWLVQSADYDVTVTAGQRWPVAATLQVLVCDARTSVTVPLRLAGTSLVGLQSCLVDNRPAAVTIQPQSGDLQVTWTRSEQAVSAIGHDQPTLHTISLRLQAPWKRTANEARFSLPIPSAPCSHWTLSGNPLATNPTTNGTTAATDPASATRRPVTQTVGPIPLLEKSWSEPGTTPATNVDIEVTEVWEVGATLVEAHTRSLIRPRSGPLQRLIVDLPPGAAVSGVRIQPEARMQRLVPNSTSRPAVIEFAEPLTEPATIELDYVVPHATSDGEFFGRGLLWRAARTRATLPQSRRWAIAVLPDIRVEPKSLENSGLTPVSRASVQESLAGLLGDRTPQAVYQVQGEAPIPFAWETLTSRRQLLLWQQTGTLGRDRLRWELEGDLEVVGAPVYSHVLSIDRRLRVESVSVRERGAERLVRWSETRFLGSPGSNRITLFLSDPCVETQRITLTATASIPPDAPLSLPNIRCEDAELRGGRLLFTAPAGTDVSWSSTRGLRSLNPDSSNADEPMAGTTWIYDQTEADWRA
ncbi:MAG TPA: hypothetical protein VM165_22740, partial [Planctomycetaceae bacterium]|nr:hypothetical protein [Planctomycetaceae bacterium]